jgi:hypothetical protein
MWMMERMITAATPATQNSRFYVFGVAGVVFGLGLMVMAVVHARYQPSPPSPWGTNFLLFVGQVVASAGGYVAVVIPLMRRRERAARVTAGLCPACGHDLRATTDRRPDCGSETGAA